MAGYNPIDKVGTKVDDHGEIIDGVSLPVPTSYQYEWEDISASTSGRTEDLQMHINRLGRSLALNIGWDKVNISDCAAIINAFKPEYVYVRYLDAETGSFQTRQFYAGSGSVPLFNTQTGKWDSISFKITARGNVL